VDIEGTPTSLQATGSRLRVLPLERHDLLVVERHEQRSREEALEHPAPIALTGLGADRGQSGEQLRIPRSVHARERSRGGAWGLLSGFRHNLGRETPPAIEERPAWQRSRRSGRTAGA